MSSNGSWVDCEESEQYHLTPADAALLEKVKSYSGSPNDDILLDSESLQAAAIYQIPKALYRPRSTLNQPHRDFRSGRTSSTASESSALRSRRRSIFPPGLLTEIFVFAFYHSGDWLHNNYPLGLWPDTVKPRISRSETRSLWHSLHISMCARNERVVLWLCSVLPRHVPLSIDFALLGFGDLCSMAVKMAVCKRVQEVTLDLSPEGYDELWAAMVVHQASLKAQHMDLRVDDVISLQQLMMGLPSGRNDTANPLLESRFGIPGLMNLKVLDLRLSLKHDSSILLYNFLTLCPRLKILKLQAYFRLRLADSKEHNYLNPITFPDLQMLHLESISCTWLFRVLAAPTLHQREIFEVSANLPSLLKAAPNLMECTLSGMVVPDVVLRGIACGDLLSRLVELHITPETLLEFGKVVEARVRREVYEEGGLRLRSAWAACHDCVTEEEVNAADREFRLLCKDYGIFCRSTRFISTPRAQV
ncbi:hypothetical protein DXG03_004868 [Asterophora parasitica]|uniref:F-box domain-containing protein n=1 Tax=Asterophora parasitica TaxID=117018 RepID=A0A9P7KDQ8_9AGAR|nr:hypothetical protein DXG03_004868 [Asterophora parasitica]